MKRDVYTANSSINEPTNNHSPKRSCIEKDNKTCCAR